MQNDMKELPNNCRVGNISVHPKNWKTVKVNPKTTWKIVYWFSDDKSGLKKQIKKKGMNDLTDLVQDITETLLDVEVKLLERGHNPITNRQVLRSEENPNIPTERMLFNDGITMAYESLV